MPALTASQSTLGVLMMLGAQQQNIKKQREGTGLLDAGHSGAAASMTCGDTQRLKSFRSPGNSSFERPGCDSLPVYLSTQQRALQKLDKVLKVSILPWLPAQCSDARSVSGTDLKRQLIICDPYRKHEDARIKMLQACWAKAEHSKIRTFKSAGVPM